MARTHAPHTTPSLAAGVLRSTLCGWGAYDPDRSDVDCKLCLKTLAAASPVPPEDDCDAFAPAAPEPAVYGARELSSTGRRAIARALVERNAPKRTWKSVDVAVRAWVRMRDEGASLRSTCDPDRANRVQTSRDPSLGGREHDAIEQTATVGRALDRATMRILALNAACPLIYPEQARSVYLLSVAGKAVQRTLRRGTTTLKQACPIRISKSIEDVAAIAAEEYELPITWRHVVNLRAHYDGVLLDALVASGEMRGARPRQPRAPRPRQPPPWAREARNRTA